MEQFLTHLGGTISGLVVGYAVLKTRLDGMSENVKTHEQKLERVLYRDECERRRGDCVKHGDERHCEVIKRLDKLEASFKTCMEDLVDAMRCKSDIS